MSRKILISIINKDSLTFEINEDAKKRDCFSLNNLNKVNLSSLEKSLKNEKDKIISSYIENNRDHIFSKMKTEDLEFEKILKNLDEIKEKNIELKGEIKLKEQDINEANKRIETEKQLATSIVKEDLSKQVNYLENELKLKTQAVDNINNKINLEIKLAVADEKNKLKDDIRILESRRDKMSIKDIGEDLENFMKTEFSNNFGSSHAKFEKINISTDGKKPDFKFSIFDTDQSIISSIILEAKSEALNSKTKTKNHNHLEKLDLDRKKNNGEYAILVSELEKNEDRFIFKKVTDYEQMFIVRPQYFIALLYLIYNLEIKKRGVQDLEITFKERQEILHEFNSMKENIIDETIPLITNKINNIINKAEKIEAISQEIIADGNTTLGSRNIATLIRKIEK